MKKFTPTRSKHTNLHSFFRKYKHNVSISDINKHVNLFIILVQQGDSLKLIARRLPIERAANR